MKKNVLKMATLAVALGMVSLTGAYAQEAGEMAAGGNAGVAFGDGFSKFGIGAKFQYNVTKEIRGEGSFTYFLGDFNFWDLSANAHYLIGIPNVPLFKVYPLAGLSLLGSGGGSGSGDGIYYIDPITGKEVFESFDDDGGSSGTSFGLNFGGGADYKLTDRISVQGELKYRIGINDINHFCISVGVSYKF